MLNPKAHNLTFYFLFQFAFLRNLLYENTVMEY